MISDEERYKTAVATRQFEIQMLWQRSGYFLALNSAIVGAFFSLGGSYPYNWLLAFLGFPICLCWFCVTLGGKFWQMRWEDAAWQLEGEQDKPERKLFSAKSEEVHDAVKRSIKEASHTTTIGGLIDWLVLFKPSVSSCMLSLSALFILFWIGVGVIGLFKIFLDSKSFP